MNSTDLDDLQVKIDEILQEYDNETNSVSLSSTVTTKDRESLFLSITLITSLLILFINISNFSLSSKDTTYFSKVTPAYKTKNTVEADVEMFQLKAGITKVRIYMWVEGQDVDCENTASGSNIAFDVKFSIPAK